MKKDYCETRFLQIIFESVVYIRKKIKGHSVQYFFMSFSARTFRGFPFDRLIVSERILGRLRSALDGEKSTTRHFGPINGETGHRENTISI